MYCIVHVALRKTRKSLARLDELAKREIQGISAPKKRKPNKYKPHCSHACLTRVQNGTDTRSTPQRLNKKNKKLINSGAVKEKHAQVMSA